MQVNQEKHKNEKPKHRSVTNVEKRIAKLEKEIAELEKKRSSGPAWNNKSRHRQIKAVESV